MLDEIGEHPGPYLSVRYKTVRHLCHDAFGINDSLQTHELIVENL